MMKIPKESTYAKVLENNKYYSHLQVLCAHSALDREVISLAVRRVGLALAGFLNSCEKGSIWLLDRDELNYWASKYNEPQIIKNFANKAQPALLILCEEESAPDCLVAALSEQDIPLVATDISCQELAQSLSWQLGKWSSPRDMTHGTLLDIFGVGVLLKGKSGIGKSECALELIMRGHPLVADDVVDLTLRSDHVNGSSPEPVRNLLEIRGLGIVNVRDLFGIIAVRDSKKIDMVIELTEWQPGQMVERLGVEEEQTELLGISLPYLVIPVRLGRDLGSIIEVAARNLLLRQAGINTALALEEHLDEIIAHNKEYGE